jgi:hypothetical protein
MDFSASTKHSQTAPGGVPFEITRTDGLWSVSGPGAPEKFRGRTWIHVRDLRAALRDAFAPLHGKLTPNQAARGRGRPAKPRTEQARVRGYRLTDAEDAALAALAERNGLSESRMLAKLIADAK